MLEHILPKIEDAQIKWPTFQREFARLLKKKPLVVDKFAFVDGKNFRVKRPSRLMSSFRTPGTTVGLATFL